jgi:signal transduction histidine kinase
VIPKLLKAGKPKILASTAALVALTTLADWASGNNISLAALYILPMMLGALVLGWTEIAALALLCSYLRFWFDVPSSPADLALRFVFAALAYFLSGLFVAGLVRKHEEAIRHLSQIQFEQTLRRDAEEQLRVLAESSPAAIFTVDEAGRVLAANASADRLFMLPVNGSLHGRLIGNYLPFLGEVLRWKKQSVGLRTATQCQGFRENGEIFLAHIWFSSYVLSEGRRLAAIVVDSSDEMREREEHGLRQLQTGNQIAAAAMAHEVRNVCEAMAMLCADLRRRHALERDESLHGLDELVSGLEAMAYLELQPKSQEVVEEVPLKEVLDNLRIIVEPAWREIEGTVQWRLPADAPAVWAQPHGLLQVFLNLAQNSHRAVQESPDRTLLIEVCSQDRKVIVKFRDSGPGIKAPEILFQPFQKGAAGSGLGLYLSRSIVRNYGGELRFEAASPGSCFIIELEAV